MTRPVTLFTGQWADLPLEELAKMAADWGYDGLELACWGDHFDPELGARSKRYCDDRHALLAKYGLKCWAISHHLAGQLVCDNIDARHYQFTPPGVKKNPQAARAWAVKTMKQTARAAANMKIKVVNGFTGSSIWHLLYSFPPALPGQIEAGYAGFAKRWTPILDVFADKGVRFALEVHPTEIAFDTASAERALKAVNNHKAFGFNYDPSHLGYQGVDYVDFIRRFGNRIFHVHMKDAWWDHGDGSVGVFGGHTEFGDPRRQWDFRSLGHGDIMFEDIMVALNDMGYKGPLSVEWEDSRMDRCHGAREACEFVKSVDFPSSNIAFDSQFDR
ncbi:MAG: sugar phosphate isomerase/epimerase [Kiritimatiellia bacterium]|jgi:sugar phosphate isomerase/epimerase|nr:sugar phosphate isomerase/epimerase [Kiritimatiellia bacterium]MDP6811513.1 sugar phosphate isomerase/epimerase [Kiritimatiellia bacterium]MDP7023691.1 sugar phosphate isomerase/epimerase [Kiritimatiellia bacterium]